MILPSSFHLAVMGSNSALVRHRLDAGIELREKFSVFLADAKPHAFTEHFYIERNGALLFAAAHALLGSKERIKRHAISHHVIKAAGGKVIVGFILRGIGFYDRRPWAHNICRCRTNGSWKPERRQFFPKDVLARISLSSLFGPMRTAAEL